MGPSLHEKLNRPWVLNVSSWEDGDGFFPSHLSPS
jgi:hypothetical protein